LIIKLYNIIGSEDKFLHPLLTAAAEGNVEKVKELLEQDAELDVNFRDPENNYSAFLICKLIIPQL
jgi:hypothetical protein